MNTGCSEFREYILRAAAGDLETSRRERLQQHLSGCASCSQEDALYASALRDLRQLTDVPVPRHFFVQAAAARTTPWSLFLRMSFAWRFAVSSAAAAVLLVGILAAAQIRVRYEARTVTLAFGRLPESPRPAPQPAPAEKVDTKALQDEIVRVLAERNRNENLEWVRTLRAEIGRAGAKWSDQQRLILATALEGLEARMDNRIVTATQTFRSETDRSMAELYQAVSLERERDGAELSARIDRVALTAEAKGSQTDVILDTLLQVAELRLK